VVRVRRVLRGAVGVLIGLAGLVTVADPGVATPGDVAMTSVTAIDSVALAPDDSFWGTDFAGNRLVRVEPTTLETEAVTGAGVDGPLGMVAGGDGGLWFLNFGDSSIGRLDPTTRAVTAHVVDDLPTQLVLGPADVLWFLDADTGDYGTVATDGTLTRYDDPRVRAPSYLALGPPGTGLWIADGYARRLVNIDPDDGTATGYRLPRPWTSEPDAIVAGPDGELWLIGPGNRLGHFDPITGTATVVTTPMDPFLTGEVAWRSVLRGPDGEVWLADRDWLGRVDPDTDDVDHYPVGLGTVIDGDVQLVDGPGGTLWLLSDGNLGPVETDPAATDTIDPTSITRTPAAGLPYYLITDDPAVDIECADDVAVADCFGRWPASPLLDGEPLYSGDPGAIVPTHDAFFTTYARDEAGNTSWKLRRYGIDAVCRGERANVFSIHRLSFYGRSGPGDDVVVVDATAWGYGGDDLICAGGNADGGRGNDRIFGGPGTNHLSGGHGRDRLLGSAGPDLLVGGPGYDVCYGGPGNDTFQGCEVAQEQGV
jgi:virginiamycin B lyase